MPGKDLIIYGASNPSVLKILDALNRETLLWNLVGFIDDTPEMQDSEFYGFPVLGGRDRIESFDPENTFFFNNVFGSMPARKKVGEILKQLGCQLTSLISPDSDLAFVEVGKDVAIEQRVSIDALVKIGDHCCVKRSASVGHEVVMENYVFVGPGATVCGRVRLREGVYVGAGSCIKQELEIGSFSVIGAGAVVIADVPPNTTVVGNPAKSRE